MGSVVKARRYETGEIVFAEQRLLPLGLDTALIHSALSHHPSVVPSTSLVLLFLNIVRGIWIGPCVFKELGFKCGCHVWSETCPESVATLPHPCKFLFFSNKTTKKCIYPQFHCRCCRDTVSLVLSGDVGPMPGLGCPAEKPEHLCIFTKLDNCFWPPLVGGQSYCVCFTSLRVQELPHW